MLFFRTCMFIIIKNGTNQQHNIYYIELIITKLYGYELGCVHCIKIYTNKAGYIYVFDHQDK